MQPFQPILLCYTSKKTGDWKITIHSRHGDKPFNRKHVHISKNGLKGEYSWNEDGTRHDCHKFPISEKCINAAKKHAAEALNVNLNILSFIGGIEGGVNISLHNEMIGMPLFNSYLSKRLTIVVFCYRAELAFIIYENL